MADSSPLFFTTVIKEFLPLSLKFLLCLDRRNGHQQKSITVSGLKTGTHLWMPVCSGYQRKADSRHSSPHASQPVSATSFASGVTGLPLTPCTLPVCTAWAKRQNTFCPFSPGHSQAWGFSIGLKVGAGGWDGWGEPENKEIGSKYTLRWNGLLVYLVGFVYVYCYCAHMVW